MILSHSHKIDITIAILNYNRSMYLERSIRSCLDQVCSSKNIEIIVIDDNSTDKSIKILNYYKKNINLILNKKNLGIGHSSKLAVNKSRGEYFIRVDSDDYLNRQAIQVMSDILDFNEEISYVYADHYNVKDYGLKQKLVKLDKKNKLYKHGAGIMFRKNIIKKVGNYNKSFLEAEDHDLLFRIDKAGYKSYRIPIPLYRYYIHKNNISNSNNRTKYEKKIYKR